MSKTTRIVRKRKWLNKKYSSDTGSIDYSVSFDNYNIDASVTVRDCSRSSTLNFSIYANDTSDTLRKKDIVNALYKLRVLKESIIEMEEAIKDAVTLFNDAKKED